MSKKKLLSLSLVVIMIAILSFSTLAWFSDSDSVTNDFNVGGESAEDIFNLDVYESVDTDGDGKIDKTIGWEGDTSEDGKGEYTYENVVPGDLLWKKVYAHNKGNYDQWIRFKVTFDNASDWQALENKYGIKLHDILMEDKDTKLVESDDWTFAPNETVLDAEKDTVTYVFYHNTVLEAVADDSNWVYLFHYVKIPYQFNQADMAMFDNGDFRLVATGEAIQVENIEAATAQEAFAKVESTQTIG